MISLSPRHFTAYSLLCSLSPSEEATDSIAVYRNPKSTGSAGLNNVMSSLLMMEISPESNCGILEPEKYHQARVRTGIA